MTTEQLKNTSIGHWESIAVEIRPSNTKNADGTLKPFYLRRDFTLLPEDRFELAVTNYADPFGKIPLAKMFIKGHIEWQGEHSITAGAQKVNFAAMKNTLLLHYCKALLTFLTSTRKDLKNGKLANHKVFLKKHLPRLDSQKDRSLKNTI